MKYEYDIDMIFSLSNNVSFEYQLRDCLYNRGQGGWKLIEIREHDFSHHTILFWKRKIIEVQNERT